MKAYKDILEQFRDGTLDMETAMEKLRSGLYEDLGHSRVDLDRLKRNGSAEVIFGLGKTARQIIEIAHSLRTRGQDVLVTRLEEDKAPAVLKALPEATYHETSRLLTLQNTVPSLTESTIAVVCAGTSDLPVAEEARLTAEFYGNRVTPIYDAGVAGLHRLLAERQSLQEAKVVVTVAGMEGALPSVVAGLVSAPVIAVPTSVGYGANFGGLAALLAMLNSCASGMSVVNIDNGFGAGFLASRINQL
jgi:NCAIR mutase (PurE)-related protein